jgi:hypothetical protein
MAGKKKKSRLDERIESYKKFDAETAGTDVLLKMLEDDLEDQSAVTEDVELNREVARRRLAEEDQG